jgi:hypothetical protein
VNGYLDVKHPLLLTGTLDLTGTANIATAFSFDDILFRGGSLNANSITLPAGHRISGWGQVNGNLVNAGIIEPGSSPGMFVVDGDYTQSGTLVIEIFDMASFDEVVVRGNALLGGTLEVSLLDGAWFGEGASFAFLTAATRTGGFSQMILPTMPNGDPIFSLSYNSTGTSLTALETVPEPGTLSFLAAGGTMLLLRRNHGR